MATVYLNIINNIKNSLKYSIYLLYKAIFSCVITFIIYDIDSHYSHDLKMMCSNNEHIFDHVLSNYKE